MWRWWGTGTGVLGKSLGCPTSGSIQGQFGWCFQQPGLVKCVPAHGRWVGRRWSLRSFPTQAILDSMIIQNCSWFWFTRKCISPTLNRHDTIFFRQQFFYVFKRKYLVYSIWSCLVQINSKLFHWILLNVCLSMVTTGHQCDLGCIFGLYISMCSYVWFLLVQSCG